MAENSHIGWTTHTFNTCWGCTKVSAGCKHCYADTLARRFGDDIWGPGAGRKPMSDKYWASLDKWQRKAEKGVTDDERHPRVFCNSMSDLFEGPETCQTDAAYAVVTAGRARLFAAIARTPNLQYLLLTKRPENMNAMVPESWKDGWPANVWAGTSVEDQENADRRIPLLLQVPARRFLSVEPLLGPIDLWSARYDWPLGGAGKGSAFAWGNGVSWVIVGGESGPGARPMHPDWVRRIRDDTVAAEVPFFFKQWGAWVELGQSGLASADEARETVTVEPSTYPMQRGHITLCLVGKEAAGRVLDGREWDALPVWKEAVSTGNNIGHPPQSVE